MARNSQFVLQKGDRVVFFGDSITQAQLYTDYVQTYLQLKFPHYGLSFFNAGWGGDTAPAACERLERDVLKIKPSVVTLCFGMNDGQYRKFEPAILKSFSDGMAQLVKRLRAAGVRQIVLLTPGYADGGSNSALKSVDYSRSNLRKFADFVLKLAKKEHLPVADLHKLMTDAHDAGRKVDPSFSLAPGDGIHPDESGHLVMAYGLLKALGVPESRIEIKANAQGCVAPAGEAISVLSRKTDYGYSFALSFRRLPFFVEPNARKVLPFLPFQEDFNTVRLSVKGIARGKYYLRYEKYRGPVLTADEVESGIDLSAMWSEELLLKSAVAQRHVHESSQVYFKLWRTVGIDTLGTYLEAPHAAAIQVVPLLDAALASAVSVQPPVFNIRIVSTLVRDEIIDNGDFISTWNVCGPFPTPNEADRLCGEAKFDGDVMKAKIRATTAQLDMMDPGNNMVKALSTNENCFAYAWTILDSLEDQEATLNVGTDDGYAIWLNQKPVTSRLDVRRGLMIDQDMLTVKFKKGRNFLLVKLTQYVGGWGFCIRFNGLKQRLTARPR